MTLRGWSTLLLWGLLVGCGASKRPLLLDMGAGAPIRYRSSWGAMSSRRPCGHWAVVFPSPRPPGTLRSDGLKGLFLLVLIHMFEPIWESSLGGAHTQGAS
jgi:hypothetical protein